MLTALRSFLSNQRGAAAAEMALILPAALALLFTTFEGTWYIVCEHRVIKGVRDASRYAARLDLTNYGCPGGTFTGPTASIQNLARTGRLSGGTSQVPGWVNSDVTVAVSCTTGMGGIYAATGGNAPKVNVYATVNYPSMMGALGFGSGTVQIKAKSESPVIGL
jgi:Flp pilus assembly protein TadG